MPIVGAGKFEICGSQDSRLEIQGRPDGQLKSKGSQEAEFPLPQETSICFQLRLSTD